ncbi:MAG: endo-1,4-beta-xylanase [Cyclobacteriaceae bacterium]
MSKILKLLKPISSFHRHVMAVLLLAVAFNATSQDPLATGNDKFLGNVYSSSQQTDYTQYWNQVTPENGGKWGSVEGTRDYMRWGTMDAAYALARDNGFPFKQHVMIWGSQQPEWIDELSTEEQLEEIIEWFSELSARYPDIDIVEVVNEPLHAPPSYAAALGGSGETGWDWIISSFELARTYFPNAKLILNDYGILGSNENINKYLRIVRLLIERELIDQLGVQGHAFTVNDLDPVTITSNLNALASAGLPLFVTELDIDGNTDENQLSRYRKVFPALWEHPDVKGITLWGWRPGMWRTEQKAYLINSVGTERPALRWLRQYVYFTTTGTMLLETPNVESIPKIYPNPISDGNIFITGEQADMSIQLFNLQGKKVLPLTQIAYNRLETPLMPGVYLAKVFVNGALKSTQRIIIQSE